MKKLIYKKGDNIFKDRYTYSDFIFQNYFDPLAELDTPAHEYEAYYIVDTYGEHHGRIYVGYGETPQGFKYYITEIEPNNREIKYKIDSILEDDYTIGQFDTMLKLIAWYTGWLR